MYTKAVSSAQSVHSHVHPVVLSLQLQASTGTDASHHVKKVGWGGGAVVRLMAYIIAGPQRELRPQ